MRRTTSLTVNNKRLRVEADPDASLLSVLRNDLELTGSKYGCGEGECGACTVLIDGQPAKSCVTRLRQVSGKRITTIEGLEQDGRLHPLQEAFLEFDALQCGFCTSGMIMAGVALLNKNSRPGREEIVCSMNGNICRCCTYPRIVAAIEGASRATKEGS